MSRRKKRDDFIKTWSQDQAEQQRKDRTEAVVPPTKYASGGAIPQPISRKLLAEYERQLLRFTAPPSFAFLGGTPEPDTRFAGSEFAMGTAVGVRSWEVDKLGRLCSPQYPMIWTPGEVIAECKRPNWGLAYYDYEVERKRENHTQASCHCGFYAYYEGFNEYAKPDRITGVIEGYGETQIGTRGFKSAKARIVALHVPDTGTDQHRIGKTPFARVRENYGQHVAIFTDYAQMLSEFPTTQPEGVEVTPDTDPDFWTRSA